MKKNDDLQHLDEAIRNLRIAYEKYFAGIERREPVQDRTQVKALLRQLRSEPTSNTARRFRLQQLQSSLVTYENYWNRITRQIEEGTFKRDKIRAEKLMASRTQETPPTPDPNLKQEEARAEPQATTSPQASRPHQPASQQSYPKSLISLHEAYKTARKSLGQASNLSIDSLANTIQQQTEAIKSRYKCEVVEFKVAIKDGKAILKAVPR